MERPSWAPDGINLDVPSVARMYDYYLGGMHNFEIDRQMAERGVRLWPNLPTIMRANRAFLIRAVRYLVEAGYRQFLDIGSGIPTAGNVHEIAQAAAPDSRVVYVDIDPVAVAHSRALLRTNSSTAVVQGDVRAGAQILSAPDVSRLFDRDRPIALLLVALLHFIPDSDDPAGIVARLRDALPPGSALVLSHFSNEGTPEQVEGLQRLSQGTPTPLTLRPRARIAELFAGFTLVEPGLVYLPQWRPEPSDAPVRDPESYNDFCGVGIKN